MSINIEVSGDEQLSFDLQNASDDVVRAVRNEIDATVKRINNTVRDEAPQDTTGLVNGYQTLVEPDGLTGYVYNAVEYARRIELGFQGTDDLGRSYNQPGQFPLTNAFNKETSGFDRRIRNRLP